MLSDFLSFPYLRLYLHRKMSWDSYLTTLMQPDQSGGVPVAEAAICGYNPGEEAVWAKTPNFNITVDEIKKLAAKDRSSFGQSGVYVGGVRCRMIRDQLDTNEMWALDLKTAADAEGKAYGICVGKSVKALVIAKGKDGASGGQVASKVFGVVSYLRKSNY